MMTTTGRRAAVSLMLAASLGLGGCGIFKKSGKATPTLGERVPILVSENAAEVDPALAGVQVLLPEATPNANWAQPGGSASKSNGHPALGATIARVWAATIDSGSNRRRLAATPTIADGKLFVVDVEAVVHAFDARSGARLWSSKITDTRENRDAVFGGGVSVDDGRLFASDGLGDVVSMNAADGQVGWRVKPGGPLRGAPTIANGQIYVLSQDNQLFALDRSNGQVVWTQSASLESQGVFGVAAPASSAGTVVAGFSSGELSAFRYENGRTLWQDALARTSISTSVSSLSDIDAEPVIDDGRVYAIGQGGRMVALELATGQRLWEQNFASISTPWVVGEWVFVVTDDARLVAVSRANGRVRWISQLRGYRNEKKKSGAYTWFGPVLAGNRLWLTNSRGELVGVNPADGAVATTIDAADSFSLPPVVADATLYTLDDKGRIAAYR